MAPVRSYQAGLGTCRIAAPAWSSLKMAATLKRHAAIQARALPKTQWTGLLKHG